MKRILIAVLLALFALQANAATKTFGAVAGTWKTDALWSPAGRPTASDDVVFNALSAACTVDSVTNCLTLDFTGYTQAFLVNDTLKVLGNLTAEADAIYLGTKPLVVGAAATLTSDGETDFNIPVQIGTTALGNATYVLSGDWQFTGGLTIAGTAGAVRTINTDTMYVTGNLSVIGITTGNVTGSTVAALKGTGSTSFTFTAGGWRLDWAILSGTRTLTGTLRVGGGNSATGKSLTYAGGTVSPGTSNVIVGTGAYSIICNAAGMQFATLTCLAPVTFSGTEGCTIGTLTYDAGNGGVETAGHLIPQPLAFQTGWTASNITSRLGGDVVTGAAPANVYLACTSIGRRYRITIVGTTDKALTLNGTIAAAIAVGGSSITLAASGAFSYTLDYVANTAGVMLRCANATTTFSISTFTLYELPTVTWASGETYNITSQLTARGISTAQPMDFMSSTPDDRAFINVTGRQSVRYVEATDVPAVGKMIYDLGGVIDNSARWNAQGAPLVGGGGGREGYSRSAWGRTSWGR